MSKYFMGYSVILSVPAVILSETKNLRDVSLTVRKDVSALQKIAV